MDDQKEDPNKDEAGLGQANRRSWEVESTQNARGVHRGHSLAIQVMALDESTVPTVLERIIESLLFLGWTSGLSRLLSTSSPALLTKSIGGITVAWQSGESQKISPRRSSSVGETQARYCAMALRLGNIN